MVLLVMQALLGLEVLDYKMITAPALTSITLEEAVERSCLALEVLVAQVVVARVVPIPMYRGYVALMVLAEEEVLVPHHHW
jgi:hypothetical protein